MKKNPNFQNHDPLRLLRASVVLMSFCVLAAGAEIGAENVGLNLARELVREGDHHGAAIEFRRLALAEPAPQGKGGFFWTAGYEYWKAGDPALADKMLDFSEETAPEFGAMGFLLRGETALSAEEAGEASYYFESILKRSEAAPEARALAARRLAGIRVREGQTVAAQDILAAAPGDQSEGLAALEDYAEGRDKNPRLGGLLGIIPGLGYAYSGEYANGVRSLLLNALFIWGMADTADDEEWGAFAVITFFEFTWYSGSIYGGLDAAHRFNRRRLESCTDAIAGISSFEPDYDQLPTLALKFEF